MGLVDILVAVLVVLALYHIAKWALGVLKVNIPDELLTIGAIILLIFILLGKVTLGL